MKRPVYRFTLVASVIGLVVCASAAQAQQAGEPPRDPNAPRPVRVSFLQSALDKNKDAELSVEEIASAPASLQSLDKNKDAKLSGDELRPPPPPVGPTVAEMVTRLMEFDGDGNGTLSKDELPDQLATIFTEADTNRDKILTNAELTTLVEKQEAEAKERAAKQPAPPVPTTPRPGARPMRVPPLQAALDTNSDGEITKEEIASAASTLLALDKDKDGKVSAEELRPAPLEEHKSDGPPAPPKSL